MSASIHYVRLRRARLSYEQAVADDPVLRDGELCFVYDYPGASDKLKIGDGIRHFSELPWYQDSARIPLSQKGAPGGVATLDSNGRVPLDQIPEDRRVPVEVPVVTSPCSYTGEPVAPVVYVSDPDGQLISGDMQGIETGTYWMTVKPSVNHVWPDGTTDTKYLSWSIEPEPIPVPKTEALLYDGTTQTPVWANYDPAKMSVSGETYAVEPGVYKVTFALEPNYVWEDGTENPVTVLWQIEE